MTSKPFYAILVAQICADWLWYLFLLEIPTYMKTALEYKIQDNSILSSLPWFSSWVGAIAFGLIVDRVLKNHSATTTTVRKVCTGFAALVPMVCLLLMATVERESRAMAVVLATITMGTVSAKYCGFLVNHLDIAPNFAGTLVAVTLFPGVMCGILLPIATGYMLSKDLSIRTWKVIFLISAIVTGFGGVFYVIFGTAEEQPWNRPTEVMRYWYALLGCVGLGIVYGLKVSMSVAIVSMVNHTGISTMPKKEVEDGPFLWTHYDQGLILSSYFWGYIVTNVPGGRIAEVVSGKGVMFFAVFLNVICTLLIPSLASSMFGVIAMRVGQGLGGGVTIPGTHVILSRWALSKERSFMCSVVYAGTSLGTVLYILFSGIIANGLGWKYVFYIEGLVSAIWLIFWYIFMSDFPDENRFMMYDEKGLFLTEMPRTAGVTKKFPFMPVLKSVPFWAILVAHTCSNWGFYMLLIEMPLYLKGVVKLKIRENAIAGAVPYFTMWIFSLVVSKVVDHLRSSGTMSTTDVRKLATILSSLIPAVCMIALGYVKEENKMLAIVLMTISVTSFGAMFSGFLCNHIDIAPNFAGSLVGMTNIPGTMSGIIVPMFVGALLQHDNSVTSWRIIFNVTAVLLCIELVVYTLFGSGEVQPWNEGAE